MGLFVILIVIDSALSSQSLYRATTALEGGFVLFVLFFFGGGCLFVLFFGFFCLFVLFLCGFLSLQKIAFLRSCVCPWKYTCLDRLEPDKVQGFRSRPRDLYLSVFLFVPSLSYQGQNQNFYRTYGQKTDYIHRWLVHEVYGPQLHCVNIYTCILLDIHKSQIHFVYR